MKKTALITGASKGLGATIATYLARTGYNLILTARTPGPLENLAAMLRSDGATVATVAGDIADAAHRERLAKVAQDLGGVDALVNNASELGPSPMPELADFPLDALRKVFEVNVIAQVGLVQDVWHLLKAKHGLVVNITSDAAVGGYEGWGGYGASKAALELVSKTLAAELATDGISVVTVDPGDMRTDMHQAAFPGEDISDRPLPDVTVPFWAWLFSTDPKSITGRRLQAQGDAWLLDAAPAAPAEQVAS